MAREIETERERQKKGEPGAWDSDGPATDANDGGGGGGRRVASEAEKVERKRAGAEFRGMERRSR